MAGHGFGGTDIDIIGLVPQSLFYRHGLTFIVQFCAGAMGVQIQAVRFLMEARFLQGKPNGVAGALALRMGSGDVVSVVGIAVAYDFRIDFRVSCLSVLIFLQNQDTGALSQNKAIPPLVKGNRGPLGIVDGGQRHAAGEAGDSQLIQGGLRAAGDHGVGVAVADCVERLADGMCAGGAGGYHAHRRALSVMLNGNGAGGDIGDHRRDKKRRYLFRAAVKQLFAVFYKGCHAADSGTDIDSQPFRLHSADNAAVLHSLGRGGQGVLGIKIGFPDFFLFQIKSGVEILDLRRHLNLKFLRIEPGDKADAVFARLHPLPSGLGVVADRGHRADSRDYYSIHSGSSLHCIAAVHPDDLAGNIGGFIRG